MTLSIELKTETINKLDLSPAKSILDPLLESKEIAKTEQNLKFEIDYIRDPTDPRELSEIPEIRLYFVRLDACYPWLPLILDWKGGELGRYTAMLVPHQFSRTDGIQYNPEALEIFVMNKIFTINEWLKKMEISGRSGLKSMAQTLGYEIDDAFLKKIE
ncbi:MAG: CRR6 family NdhI maturation factor [Prochloraceae cyanobacterium]|nr:CRR6 family NdhI maturation factor [Prochloraceae cyanobacterium]